MSELRNVPKIDSLLGAPALKGFPRPVQVAAARSAVAEMRRALRKGAKSDSFDVEAAALSAARTLSAHSLKGAINMSGVILHTGLGRARLAPSVVEKVQGVASSHSMLEIEEGMGTRGDRQVHVTGLLKDLTGAEDALVVNNAAAGVVLALAALAQGREVILSRGQMVEIGGSFRMPDIVGASGCVLVEVGCTNKTRLRDYSAAITELSAAFLRCHPSNFKIIGFTEEPSLKDLAILAHEKGLLCIDDMGSGCLVDTTQFDLPKEATIQESLRANPDVVIASGDKMLGGPQAGLILGKKDAIQTIKSHPLARALRVDKLTLTALQATLQLYREGRELEIPTLKYLARTVAQVRVLAEQLVNAYPGKAETRACLTEVGGGSVPGTGVPSFAAVLMGARPDEICGALRSSNPPVIGRIQEGAVWLDPRTAEESEVLAVAASLGEMTT